MFMVVWVWSCLVEVCLRVHVGRALLYIYIYVDLYIYICIYI